jgi:formylmethanofuran dehydrogenase subunit E
MPPARLHDLTKLVEELDGASWEDDLLAYRCANCDERCINPRSTTLASSRVCLGCYLRYLGDRVTGVRRRKLDG